MKKHKISLGLYIIVNKERKEVIIEFDRFVKEVVFRAEDAIRFSKALKEASETLKETEKEREKP